MISCWFPTHSFRQSDVRVDKIEGGDLPHSPPGQSSARDTYEAGFIKEQGSYSSNLLGDLILQLVN